MDIEGFENEPNAILAERAMRMLEETYGTKHPLTISALNEVLRIEALEQAAATVEPTHVTMGRLARNIDELEHKRSSQAKVMLQASEAITKAEIWLAECTTTAAGIAQQISTLEAERDQLMADMVSPDKRRQHTNEAGMAALDLLLQNASGFIDNSTIQALREQISSIAQQVHQTPASGTPLPPAQGQLGPTHCLLLGGPSERPTKGNSTEWSNTKTELTAILQNAAQSRQQACTSAALAANALLEATALFDASPA
jgi:hypothetical protein